MEYLLQQLTELLGTTLRSLDKEGNCVKSIKVEWTTQNDGDILPNITMEFN